MANLHSSHEKLENCVKALRRRRAMMINGCEDSSTCDESENVNQGNYEMDPRSVRDG